MRKSRNKADMFLHPRSAVTAALVLVSAAGLIWCFLFDGAGSPLSYAFYALSTYALVVVAIAALAPIRAVWARVRQMRIVRPFVESEEVRSGASAAWSVVFDLVYAIFTLITGFAYDSGWAVAVALYHVAISGLGLALILGFVRSRRLHDRQQRHMRELRMARTCGMLLALMALSLSGVMTQMVVQRQAWVYGTIFVITSATFTFVNLGLAIANMVRVRTVQRPALVASRAISLSKTLVQLFFLETTMIAVFGEAGSEPFRFAMESITGAAVFLAALGLAIGLIAYATRG